MLPCLIFEDDHLLVVNKPAGLNTHAPSPYAGEGLYDWLRHREPRWTSLAIIHRLDKETSGVIVFSKTPLANRSLTEQFSHRSVRKKYLLVTDRQVPGGELTIRSCQVRAGEKYVSRPLHRGGDVAETRFRVLPLSEAVPALGGDLAKGQTLIEAEPLTGRTHQIRVHAGERGFPILGDVLYGGTPAPRVFLHAAQLKLKHPASGEELTFHALPHFGRNPRLELRAALIEPELTDAYRLVHGASDGWPGWYVERLGKYLLSQGETALTTEQLRRLEELAAHCRAEGADHKTLSRRVRGVTPAQASPRLVLGQGAAPRFDIRENGLRFELSFEEGYSVGLFLDQRDNRRRLLTGHVAANFELFPTGAPTPEVLNTFAYTCAFSVCAACAGARTTSIDVSKKYLAWGQQNFRLNQLDPSQHEFLQGDVFDWLRRLHKKGRRFDAVLLDPPTFSQSKQSGLFRAERDYPRLISAALPALKAGGVLFASSNAAGWTAAEFVASVKQVVKKPLQFHFAPQPPDFPITRAEPGYLKTAWLRVG